MLEYDGLCTRLPLLFLTIEQDKVEVGVARQADAIIDQVSKRLRRTRIAVSLFYFGQGIGFASWASRIPDIKHYLNLSDAALGSILFALPLGQLCTMPFSATLVTKYGSKKILTIAAPLYVVALVNTQGVETEKLYNRPINTSFHGVWSIAGFTGALVGLLMINLHIKTYQHFLIIMLLSWTSVFINHKYLVGGKPAKTAVKRPFFIKPQGTLLQLGIIAFFSMAT